MLGLVAGSAAAQSGPQMPKVPSPPPRDNAARWSASTFSAATIAAGADAKIKSLRGALGRYQAAAWIGGKTPPDVIVSSNDSIVRDNGTFRLQYVGIEYVPFHQRAASKYLLKADGKRWDMFGIAGKYTRGESVATLKIDDATSPADWVNRMPRYMNAGFHGESPFSHLVAMASKPGSGYRVSVGEHTARILGENVLQRRIVIERTPDAAKKSGPVYLEIVFNTNFGLPVRARSEGALTGKRPVTVIWSQKWALQPMQFPNSEFKISASK